MLVWRKRNINRTLAVLEYCVPYNGAQWYEQFLQVGRLEADLAQFSSLSSECLCIYVFYCFVTFFTLPFSDLGMVGLALDLVD